MQLFKGLFTTILLFLAGTVVYAQQTILSVPSSDVLPGGEVILKQSNKFSPFGDNFVSLTPQMTIGTGKGTEASIGVGTNRATRITVGGNLTPNLTEGQKPDSMLYAHTSFLIKKTKTTLTAGGFVGGKGEIPSLTGAMLGIDQTIIPNKLRIVADYISRDESWGAFSAGFKIRPEPTTSITTAIVIPNADNQRLAFSISISKYLGKIIPERVKEEPKQNL